MRRERSIGPRTVVCWFAAALAILAAGCGSDDDGAPAGGGGDGAATKEKQVRLAYFGFAAANAFTQSTLEGVEEAAADMNATVEFFDSKFDPQTQFNQIQDATTSGRFDGILISPNGANQIVPAVEEAIAAGIKVASLEYPLGPDITNISELQVDGLTTFVGYSAVSVGKRVGEASAEACGDRSPCHVAVLMGNRQLPQDGPKLKAFEEGLAANKNAEVVAVTDANWVRDEALKATQDFIQAHPELDVIASPGGDQMIAGAEQALKDGGIDLSGEDGIHLIGTGASKSAVEAIRAGRWYGTYVELPRTEGRIGAEHIINAVRGQDVPEIVNLEEESPVGIVATHQTLEDNPDWEAEWDG